ncbi:hypothetical protein JW935_17330 [candidate division KSB1 bacterium]|nr:hypothetical protein [candidate division KSB1 bacterium]
MKRYYPLLMIGLLTFSRLSFPSGIRFHGSAKNSIYSYESDKKHTRIYQYARLNIGTLDDKLKLNLSARVLSDVKKTLPDNRRYNAYLLNLQYKYNSLDLTLGRQFLHPGTPLGGVDGLTAKYGINHKFAVCLFGGKESHYLHSFDVNPDVKSVFGGYVELLRLYDSHFQLLYLQKSIKTTTEWQISGLNLTNTSIPRTKIRLQSHYDMQNDRMHRLLASARTRFTDKISIEVAYKSQYPQVYTSSFFTIFSPEAYTRYRTGLNFEIFSGYFINAYYSFINFKTDPAQKVHLTVANDNGGIGLLYESGYAGDQLAFTFDYAYVLLPNLTASLYVDYSKYRTETIYEYDSQLANAVRLSYTATRYLSIDAEYQWLTNRFKESDSRFLNHISYHW